MIRSPVLMRPSGRSRSRAPSAGIVAVPPLCAALSGGTAALIIMRHLVPAAILAAISAVLFVAIELQRHEPDESSGEGGRRRFEFGRRVASTIFDASILAPLAWIERSASPRVAVIALVGLGASYLVSYQLARGQALGYSGSESTAYRVVTAALLVLAVLGGSVDRELVEPPLWVFSAIAVGAALRRAWDVRTQDGEPLASKGAA